MVASALPGDGKSFTAWNLARSLSEEQDQEVILIDGDFRKPHLTHNFDLADQPGFLEVMSGKCALMDVGHPIGSSKFVFIPAGIENERANERLASRSTQELFDMAFASKSGRIVVFDSAPILRASESQVLAQSVGSAAFRFSAGQLGRSSVYRQLHSGREICACGAGRP